MSRAAARSITLAVLACALAGCSGDLLGRQADGPLKGPADPSMSGLSLEPGGIATWGHTVVNNLGDSEVMIERVQLRGPLLDPQVVRVEAINVHTVAQYRTGIRLIRDEGFGDIPQHERASVPGAVVPPASEPGSTSAILVTVRALKNGQWRTDDVLLEYTVDGERHTTIVQSALGVCVQPQTEDCDLGPPDYWPK